MCRRPGYVETRKVRCNAGVCISPVQSLHSPLCVSLPSKQDVDVRMQTQKRLIKRRLETFNSCVQIRDPERLLRVNLKAPSHQLHGVSEENNRAFKIVVQR